MSASAGDFWFMQPGGADLSDVFASLEAIEGRLQVLAERDATPG